MGLSYLGATLNNSDDIKTRFTYAYIFLREIPNQVHETTSHTWQLDIYTNIHGNYASDKEMTVTIKNNLQTKHYHNKNHIKECANDHSENYLLVLLVSRISKPPC